MKLNGLNFLWLSSGLLLLASSIGAEGTRENFLSHGPGANAGAMSEAFTAVADDATAMYYNPAGLALQRGSVYAEHTPVFGGGRYNFIGFHYPSPLGSFGFGAIQYATDGIETRRNIGDSAVDASASQTAWFVPYGVRLRSLSLGDFAFGVSLKKVDENLAGVRDTGFGVDVGGLYSRTVNDLSFFSRPNLRMGVSVRNLVQPSIRLQSDKETFPTDYKVGAAFEGLLFGRYDDVRNRVISDKLVFSVDALRSSGQGRSWTLKELSRSSLSFGAAYIYRDLIPLRMGFNRDLTFGLGFGNANTPFAVDYSLTLTALAPQHRFAFSYLFTDSPPQIVASPELRQYRIVQQDTRRYRDRFITQGHAALRERRYESAIEAFENAAVLDPGSRDVRASLDQSQKALRLSKTRSALEEAKQGAAHKDSVALTSGTIASVTTMPDNKQAKAQLAQTPDLLAQLGPAEVAFFNSCRGQEMMHIYEAYRVCVASEDVQGARFSVEQVKTLALDHPVTIHLISDLASFEKRLFSAAMDQGAVAFSNGDYRKAYLRFMKAKQVFPENPDLKRQLSEFQDFYLRKQKFEAFDKLYQEQLYKLSALHYVKGEIPECLGELGELLRRNAIHEQGNFLLELLQDKKIIKEDLHEEPTVQASIK